MSTYPAYVVGGLCIVGGITGFVRTRSVPSIVAGFSVGALYLLSAERLRRGSYGGVEGALGASALLFISSIPRMAKGPVPAALALTSAGAGVYYGRVWYALKNN